MSTSILVLRDQLTPFFQTHGRQTGHLQELDGVRAFSIFFVLAAHMLPLGPSVLRLNEMAGLAGMSLFFCLSGFLITTFLWRRPEMKPFLIRRVARILPLLYLYGALVTLVLSWRPEAFWAIVTFTLNYRDSAFSGGGEWIAHLWSLSVEGHFYIAIAVIVGIFGRRGFWFVPFAAIVVLGLRMSEGATYSIRTHLRIDEILSGSMLAIWWINRAYLDRPMLDRWLCRLLPLFACLWAMSCHPSFAPIMYFRPWLTMLMVAGIMLLSSESRLKRVLSGDFLGYFSTTSYAIYIWHGLLIQPVIESTSLAIKYLINRPISFAATFVTAHFSTFNYEQHFIRWAKQLTLPPVISRG